MCEPSTLFSGSFYLALLKNNLPLYKSAKFPFSSALITKALQWGNQHSYCTYFNANNTQNYPFEPFRNFIAIGNQPAIQFNGSEDFEKLQEYLEHNTNWLVGHFSYDLKNQLEKLESKHTSQIKFPLISFFVPEHLIFIHQDHIEIKSKDDPNKVYQTIESFKYTAPSNHFDKITLETSQEHYVETVQKLINHIIEGDIYEINYCIQYLIDSLQIDPVAFYQSLCESSPTPFSVFYKNQDQYALGASPERFIKKAGHQLITQPIKGTAKRGHSPEEDQKIINTLRHDEKEMAENMMIVDLVRNDLARSSKSGTVKVSEMFGIYSFKHWHQMISTVVAQAKPNMSVAQIIKNAFPMGSMTGAPKIKVMELVERYETFKRGLYSGAIGYITPEGDFDFNVVIRTLFYDQKINKGSFMVGSAITYDADPQKEYQECLLKARPIVETLKLLHQPSVA